MNNNNQQIQQIQQILKFCEEGHDIDGTWPHPFLLRSFVVYGCDNVEKYKEKEHCLRINYYQSRLRELMEEQQMFEHKDKKQKN